MKAYSRKTKTFLIFVVLISVLLPGKQLFAQQYEVLEPAPRIPVVYLGIGLGFNDYGFGLNLEVPVTQKISINGNLGVGGWGYKLGGSINFYPTDVTGKSEISIGYSRASGLQDFETELWIEPDDTESSVVLDMNVVHTMNLTYTYYLQLGRSGKAGLSAGYAITLNQNTYDIDGSEILTPNSEKVLDIMQPGGFIVGFRFMFGTMSSGRL